MLDMYVVIHEYPMERGDLSYGLAQVIRGTFQANAGQYRNVGPFASGTDPSPLWTRLPWDARGRQAG